MNFRTLSILLIACVISCPTGCGSPKDRSASVKSQTDQVAPVSSTEKPSLKNDLGWTVPLRTPAKALTVTKIENTTQNGRKVTVSAEDLEIPGIVTFRYGPMNNEQEKYLGSSELSLVAIRRLSVNREVFAYVISAVRIDSNDNGTISHRPAFMYRILDLDGDEKFETLDPGSGNFPYVPDWVTE